MKLLHKNENNLASIHSFIMWSYGCLKAHRDFYCTLYFSCKFILNEADIRSEGKHAKEGMNCKNLNRNGRGCSSTLEGQAKRTQVGGRLYWGEGEMCWKDGRTDRQTGRQTDGR